MGCNEHTMRAETVDQISTVTTGVLSFSVSTDAPINKTNNIGVLLQAATPRKRRLITAFHISQQSMPGM